MREREDWNRTLLQINTNPWGSPGITLDDVYGRGEQKMSYDSYEHMKQVGKKSGFLA